MPKSRRQKIVHLTNTNKAGRDAKVKLVEKIHTCCDTYRFVYVYSVANMRNTSLKQVRDLWPDSVFVMGKIKILALALGTHDSNEYLSNLHRVSARLSSNVGLFFTNTDPAAVTLFFSTFHSPEYARHGNTATATVTLSKGILPGDLPASMDPFLRKLGLPTFLVNGDVHLSDDFSVCTEGQVLDSNQAQLLKLFYHQQAIFKLSLLCYYDKSTCQVTNLSD